MGASTSEKRFTWLGTGDCVGMGAADEGGCAPEPSGGGVPKPFVWLRGSRGKFGSAADVEYARGRGTAPPWPSDWRGWMGVDERERDGWTGSSRLYGAAAPGGAKPPMNCWSVPFGTGGESAFSDVDGFRRDVGVLLRGGWPGLFEPRGCGPAGRGVGNQVLPLPLAHAPHDAAGRARVAFAAICAILLRHNARVEALLPEEAL